MIYKINNDECTFCGICVKECPSGVITINKAERISEIDNSGCIECSHCAMVCPAGAVRVDGMKLQDYPEGADEKVADPAVIDVIDHLINSKRSVRNYKNDIPEEDVLADIILSGRLTATATNSQQVKAVILKGNEVSETAALIGRVLLKAVRIGLNPIGRVILKAAGLGRYADRELLKKFHEEIKGTIAGSRDVLFYKAPVVVILTYSGKGKMFGRTDCALAGQNMMLTAHSRGIGSCMIGFAEAALFTKRLRKKVGVPGNRRIGLIFTLGYRKPRYYRYPVRSDWNL